MKNTIKIVPFYKVRYIGLYFKHHVKGSGAKAIIGRLKHNKKEKIQSILIPINDKEEHELTTTRSKYKFKDSL